MLADTVIALSRKFNPDGSMSDETRQRVEQAVEDYRSGFARTITMSGCRDPQNASNEKLTHAFVMRCEAMRMGIPSDDIFLEELSMDTVGQAVFTRRELAVVEGWVDLIVVTHDYHVPRVREVFDFVYGPGYNIRYEGIPSPLKDDLEVRRREEESIQEFKKTFAGIPPGHEDIIERLFTAHKLYVPRSSQSST